MAKLMIPLEIFNGFLDEGSDLLDKWETCTLKLSKDIRVENLQELFRIAHSLKGSSRSVGLKEFGDTIHRSEELLTLAQKKIENLDANGVSFFLFCHTFLSQWIETLRNDPEADYSLEEFNKRSEELDIVLQGNAQGEFFTGDLSKGVINEPGAIVFVDDESPVTVTPDVITAPQASVKEEPKKEEKKTAENTEAKKAPTPSKVSETIRVSSDKIDKLIQLIGELSVYQAIMWHNFKIQSNSSKVFANALVMSNKITKDLQDSSLKLRMQPLQGLFQKIERMAFDVAREVKKNINLQFEGEEVELDKTVLERMVDPLNHMVRNSIDHGLETDEVRLEKGKDPKGTITISAKQDSGSVVISIGDDGKGMNKDKILSKAVEAGIAKANETYSDDEIYNFIFQPGFSTAEKVTSISGRGVGMNVVSHEIQSLSGNISIHNEEGKGCRFDLTLPTSVSIFDALIVSIQHVEYAVPLSYIDEIINVSNATFTDHKNYRCISLRNQVIPLINLSQALNHNSLPSKCPNEEKEKNIAMIVKNRHLKIAFLVDEIARQQKVVIRQLQGNWKNVFGIKGSSIFGNGEPGFVVDIPLIIESYEKQLERPGR